MTVTLEKDQAILETVDQQSIRRQAEAAGAILSESERSTEQEAILQNPDLVTPDTAEDYIPPPAYGDVYGEIRNEKNGLGTSATVTDDGRVNIHINQFNRRLSQVFIPALRQHVQSVQETPAPPPCYIPLSLGGEEGVPPPPPLNVVIQVVGSRGDVQPFVALGKVLKSTYGHRVRLATHPNFKNFVQENGLEFFSIGGDPSQLMAFMVKNPSLMPGFRSLLSGDVSQRRRDVAEYIQGCWRSCYKAGDGIDGLSERTARPFVADCIIANPPSFAHIHCAEKLGIPLHIMFTMPYSPTQAFPHPLANIQSSNADPQLTNYISYAMIDLLSWQGLGDIVNRFRTKCLGLEPVSLLWAPGMLQRLQVPHTYCWSPALIPKPKDWGSHISISGFCFLNLASNYIPSPDLQEFLDAGPPPVYIGFGSIVLDDPNALTELIFEAVRKTGQRVLLSKGWGGMGADEFRTPDSVFLLGNVPHDWLFKHVSCVVHHGGAGTTAAGITAGQPTLIVPFFGDQPFWGAMVARAGAGPDPIPYTQLTADRLADAINFCLRPQSLERARELANKIAAERGSDMGAQSFHQFLEPDRLRCTLAPSRPSAWRIKRTQIRLSAFAACTLANSNLLDFQDLKLFRPQEYYTDEGPLDPISGGFTAFVGAVGGMMMGLIDVPSETWKAVRIPAGRNRQQSKEPVQQEPVHTAESKSDLMLEDSSASNSTSNHESSSMSANADMLRPTGVHVSKGAGRFVRAVVQGPVDISVNLTRGMHNIPKLWGDNTVRPQERVSDFRSGVKAVGREFGFGFYDGVTGLVTQPWKGAQDSGASGFIKGVGKGIGGFLTKPGAACLGILSHTMQGVSKEVEKLFGSDVNSHILASRAAQGYQEWLQSSDAEKQDVIDRWKLLQKYMKKKFSPDEMVREGLETQQKKIIEDREAAANSAQPAISVDRNTPGSALPVRGGSRLPSRRANTTAEDSLADEENLRQAVSASKTEAQRQEIEALEYEEELNQVIAQSLRGVEQKSRL